MPHEGNGFIPKYADTPTRQYADTLPPLSPFVFGVFALQFLFDLRISFFPEGRQVLGGLDRAMVGSEDLEKNRDASFADRQRSVDSIQVLDARCEERRLILKVLEFGMATGRQFVSRRRELVECLLLGRREPGSNDRPYGAILDLFVAYRAVTYLLHEVESTFPVNDRQSQFGIPLG